MNEESVPKTFDWVSARDECSIEYVFLRLTDVIESDVKALQKLDGRHGDRPFGATFTLTKPSETKLVVVKQRDVSGLISGESVIFDRSASNITVKHGKTERRLFAAKPLLTWRGECKLAIDDEADRLEELWQVSLAGERSKVCSFLSERRVNDDDRRHLCAQE